MNVDNLFDTILRKAGAAASAAEVFYEASEDRPVEFDNNSLKYVATKSGRGVGLRVLVNGRIGFASTSDLSRLDELVANALESAKYGERARFDFPAACQPAAVKIFDDAVPRVSTQEMARLGQDLIDQVLARHPHVQCSADVAVSTSDERVANTRGLDIGHRATSFSVHLTALAVREGAFLWVGDGRSSARLLSDVRPIADKVIRDLDLAQTEVPIATGTYPAIFTPDAIGVLLMSISQGVNGKLVQKGASPLTGRIGEALLDPRISIDDDGLVDYGPASAPHDTEGIASTRLPLVKDGVLMNFIYDLQTAGILNATPTGNGIRGYSSQPGPGHNNTIVRPGDTPYKDMLGGIRRGLLVDSVLGGGQGNTLAGEFSVNVELGFLIENGELAGRVKNCMIFGNVYDLLKTGVASIGDTPEMKGSLSAPHFCFSGISVGAR